MIPDPSRFRGARQQGILSFYAEHPGELGLSPKTNTCPHTQVKEWIGWSEYLTFPPVHTQYVRLLITRIDAGWHLAGAWRFMVNDEFIRYTSFQCQILD